MQKGITALIVPTIFLIAGIIFISAYVLIESINKNSNSQTTETPENVNETTPEPTNNVDLTATPIPTVKPTVQSTPKPTTQPTPRTTAYCRIVTSADQNNSMSVKFVYGLNNGGANSMAGAQWDFDGNGSWDTEMSIQNGTVTHAFPSAGSYNTRLQLKLSDGSITSPCSASVNVPQGFSVSFSGKVFSDANCNKTWDTNEPFLQGVPVVIVNIADYSTYRSLTTDSGGNFSFSTQLSPGQNLTIKPEAELIPNFSKVYYAPNYTLNSSTTSLSTLLSLVPNDSVVNCH